MWIFGWFRIVEQAHQHYTMGNINESAWRGQTAHLKSLLEAPAVARFWIARRAVFSEDFQVFVDSLDSEGSALTLADARVVFRGESPAQRVLR